MEETTAVHVPKTRKGGAFTDSKDVKLHANDFNWETKIEELTDSERSLVDDYLNKCLADLKQNETVLVKDDVPPKPWESHFSSSKHHFPLKNYITHAFPLSRLIVERTEPAPWVLECGCGTGSTLLPIMRECNNKRAHFVGFDISPSALSHFESHEVAHEFVSRSMLTLFPLAIGAQADESGSDLSDPKNKRQRCESNVDLVADALGKADSALQDQKFDAMFLIFVLSALPSVKQMLLALRQLKRVMKPDGVLFFRDYALPDHNFFRFLSKIDNTMEGVAFAKGDATTQAFFHKDFASELFAAAGFVQVDESHSHLTYHCNRIENRKNGKRMDKIFINGTFKLVSKK